MKRRRRRGRLCRYARLHHSEFQYRVVVAYPSALTEGRRMAGNQPLRDDALPPRVGSPASRSACKISLAVAFGEKSHRSAIAPPSPNAALPQQVRRVHVVKYKPSTPGHPLPPQHIGEVQTTAVRIDLGASFVLTFGWAQLSKTTVRSSLMSWSA